MVLVASRAADSTVMRAEQTKDADLVVDLCARPSLLRDIAYHLGTLGFDQLPPFPGRGFARCTFATATGQIDLLAPDDAGEELLAISATSQTVAIPGGRRALQVGEDVRLTYDEDEFDVELRVPLLPGAIVVKAAAALDPRTREAPHHVQDVVHMLRVLPDPIGARARMSVEDRALLAALTPRLHEAGDVAWRSVDVEDRERARAAIDLLVASGPDRSHSSLAASRAPRHCGVGATRSGRGVMRKSGRM